MALGDTISNAVEDLTGKAEEAAGTATDDGSLEAEGESDQASAQLRKTGEDVEDVFR